MKVEKFQRLTIFKKYLRQGAAAHSINLTIHNVKLSFLVRVLASVFAKLGGQFPSRITEPKIEGTWQKFMNNDGLEIADGQENQFRLKAIAFARWTFNKFGRKLLVCDLQGQLNF